MYAFFQQYNTVKHSAGNEADQSSECDSVLGGSSYAYATSCDKFAGNKLCLLRTLISVFSVYLVYLKPFSPVETAIAYTLYMHLTCGCLLIAYL